VSVTNAAASVLAAGAGAETMSALGATGATTFFAGAGQPDMIGGAGHTQFVVGTGNATVAAGGGPDLLDCIRGVAGGAATVVGWNPAQDKIALWGYQTNEATQAVARAAVNGIGGTLVTLSDNTTIVFANVTGFGQSWFA
jgi:hypothetical protein